MSHQRVAIEKKAVTKREAVIHVLQNRGFIHEGHATAWTLCGGHEGGGRSESFPQSFPSMFNIQSTQPWTPTL